MKKTILIPFILFSLLVSCKKKESTPEETPTPANSTPTSNAATFSGLFSNQLLYSIIGSTTFTTSYGQNQAFMSTSNFNNFSFPIGGFQNAGTVSSNSVIFKNTGGYYTDSTNTSQSPPFVWQATGGVVPAFTFTNSNGWTTYTGYTAWVDTISKSNGLGLSFSGVTTADEAMIYVVNLGVSTPAATASLVLSSASGYTFNSSALSSLVTTTSAVIQVDFYRNNIQTINSKTMNFRNVTTYIKTVQVKN